MDFIFYIPKPFDLMKPYNFVYEGYRSKFFKNHIDPKNPPSELIFSSPPSFSQSEKEKDEKLQELIRHTFPIIAFESKIDLPYKHIAENGIIYVQKALRFEDLALIQKKKYLVCTDQDIFMQAVCSLFLNLEKKGSAIISFSCNTNTFDLLNLLACNFEQTKISKGIIILEKFTEKYKKQALKYLHFLFDANQPIKLFLEPQNKKLIKFFA